MQKSLCVLVFFVLSAAGANAEDRPVAGDSLALKDPPGAPTRRKVSFKSGRKTAIAAETTNDPREIVPTLSVAGTGLGDGSSGVLALDDAAWVGLGNPAGSKGYK